MITHFADTSALLHQKGLINPEVNIAISPLTVSELEYIKGHEDEKEIRYLAREAVRSIMTSNKFEVVMIDNKQIDKMIKKYSYLSNINDHRIICTAELLAKQQGKNIIFMTSDALQYLFAVQMPHLQVTYPLGTDLVNKSQEEWAGWGKYYPDHKEMTLLYSDPKINTLRCKTNEFAEIFEGSELKDVLFWNGSQYEPLKYKDIKNPYTQETIRPRNLEQKMAFHLLQNQDIKVKLLTSAWGSGKTLIALSYALEQVHKGVYSKLVFVRNNIVVADTNDIGFLPGDMRDKMSIWGAPLADHLGGQEMLDRLIDEDIVEIYPLSHMRGRSICNSIVLCDECENMNDKLVTFLMSRIEKDSEIIFCGDVAQIDHRKFEKNNGIKSMLEHLAGEPLFGTVKLLKSERGPVAALCDKIRPPI